MLEPDELANVAERFGVSDDQVRRDHLISHLLGALSTSMSDEVVFFGGTALSRTYVPYGRLSEDIDLLAVAGRAAVVDRVEQTLARAARREVGALTWERPLSRQREADHGVLRGTNGLIVRVQLLSADHYPAWPIEWTDIEQRYSDAPPARLQVYSMPAFAAAKTVAWGFRRAPRDLFDLWALAQRGALDAAACDLYRRLGPTGHPPSAHEFTTAPGEEQWIAELAAQTRLAVSADEALAVVRSAWRQFDQAP